MSTETRRAVAPATYTGTWTLKADEVRMEEAPGLLMVPEVGGELARFHVYLHQGERVYSAELTPNGDRWRGEEERRTPHPFRLELEALVTDGAVEVFGTLWTDGSDGEGTPIGATFGLHRPDDPERETRET